VPAERNRDNRLHFDQDATVASQPNAPAADKNLTSKQNMKTSMKIETARKTPPFGGVEHESIASGIRTRKSPRWHRLRSGVKVAMTACMAVCIAFIATGCGNMNSSPVVPAEAYKSKPNSTLAAGDEINVAYSGAPEMNSKQKIQANGKVSLPMVGDVSAAGRSITSFQSTLTSLYQSHLQDPTVIVSVEEAAAGVYVSGEVLRPGKIPLDRPMTALEAVMEAGGFTKFANPKQVIVVRNQSGKNQRYVLNMNDALYGSDSSPFYLRAYDVVYVKQSNW
jgi:polysaccharide export outer membrane protein